jgi:hypothetical protein
VPIESKPSWDAFISYASEDRGEVAEPLAGALAELGVRVWYDRTELKVGDSLRERIDEGLANSRFGIVILSPAFFKKHYPVRELNGLAQREFGGEKVLLPIWHGVNDSDVRSFSPPLADRIAAQWNQGLDAVVEQLYPTLGRRIEEEVQEAARKINELRVLTKGSELVGVLDGVHAHCFIHDEFESREEAERIGTLLEGLVDTIDDGLVFVGAAERARLSFEYGNDLKSLREAGWKVFGAQVQYDTLDNVPGSWAVACIAAMRDNRRHVAHMNGQFFVADIGKKHVRD